MPNIAGREFAYTPQGMAAAQQYKQSLGMRGGGMMGFRPVGYADGDLVEAGGINPLVATGQGRRSVSNAIDTVKDLVQKFSAQAVSDPVKEAVNIATYHLGMPVDLVNSALEALGIPVSDTPIGGSRNLKEIIGMGAPADLYESPGVAEVRRTDRDIEQSLAERERWAQGPQPSLHHSGEGVWPGPLAVFKAVQDNVGPIPSEEKALQRILAQPEQRAHGGYMGRGTSAGELAPRGSMSVREAGETMYELAKRRRGMRGGGIMSLRR